MILNNVQKVYIGKFALAIFQKKIWKKRVFFLPCNPYPSLNAFHRSLLRIHSYKNINFQRN